MGLFKPERAGRDNEGDGTNSRGAWFKAGHYVNTDDAEISRGNAGLGRRERRNLDSENFRPWGLSPDRHIAARAAEAQRRGKVQKRRGWTETDGKKQAPSGWFGSGKRLTEKREGPFGHQTVTKKNKGWFS